MGSLRFYSATDSPRFGACVSDFAFKDEDDVQVIASLYLDQTGALFELDMWKVDFSPLHRWPCAADLHP
jgi:hypothetical protein